MWRLYFYGPALLGYRDIASTFKKDVNARDFFKLEPTDEMEIAVIEDIIRLESEMKRETSPAHLPRTDYQHFSEKSV